MLTARHELSAHDQRGSIAASHFEMTLTASAAVSATHATASTHSTCRSRRGQLPERVSRVRRAVRTLTTAYVPDPSVLPVCDPSARSRQPCAGPCTAEVSSALLPARRTWQGTVAGAMAGELCVHAVARPREPQGRDRPEWTAVDARRRRDGAGCATRPRQAQACTLLGKSACELVSSRRSSCVPSRRRVNAAFCAASLCDSPRLGDASYGAAGGQMP